MHTLEIVALVIVLIVLGPLAVRLVLGNIARGILTAIYYATTTPEKRAMDRSIRRLSATVVNSLNGK